MKRLFRRLARLVWDRTLRRPAYEKAYLKSYGNYLWRRLRGDLPPPEVDLVMVLPEMCRGWILEGICREIGAYYPGSWTIVDGLENLPPARCYFLPQYVFVADVLKSNPLVWGAQRVILFTHPKVPDLGGPETIYALNRMTKVVSMCSLFAQKLESMGVSARRLTTVVGGAQPERFIPHLRRGAAVGFSSAFYARKDPDRILSIIKAMPHRKFILMGRRWADYERFSELLGLKNFTYAERPYEEYQQFYDEIDVFVSASRLEGGPIPLLEAMLCNIVPVASHTGFAPDVIEHGKNGLLFDVDAPVEVICECIDRAYEITGDIRATVSQFTWQRFTELVIGTTSSSHRVDPQQRKAA